jgi:hypothetical protein
MANKRMFSQNVIENDNFLELSFEQQCLYFHLCMAADDDGFVDSPKRIAKVIGSSQKSIDALEIAGYVISFDSGVVLMSHWNINNMIRKDRYKATMYQKEKSECECDENGVYVHGIPNDNHWLPQVSIGKNSIDKDSIDKKKTSVHQEADALFESLWKLYPNKKGKGQVSDSNKMQLLDIGYEHMVRAIDRYKADLDKDKDWRRPQNGSTFFHSGYVDYLDYNYGDSHTEKKSDVSEEQPIDRFGSLKSQNTALYDDLVARGIIDGQSIDMGSLTDSESELLSELGCI